MSDHAQPTSDETFDMIEQSIESIRVGAAIEQLAAAIDADDTPVRDAPIEFEVRRDRYGDWRISLITEHGNSSGNFGPRPGNMLAGLFDFLRECGGGDWTAFCRDTGKAI